MIQEPRLYSSNIAQPVQPNTIAEIGHHFLDGGCIVTSEGCLTILICINCKSETTSSNMKNYCFGLKAFVAVVAFLATMPILGIQAADLGQHTPLSSVDENTKSHPLSLSENYFLRSKSLRGPGRKLTTSNGPGDFETVVHNRSIEENKDRILAAFNTPHDIDDLSPEARELITVLRCEFPPAADAPLPFQQCPTVHGIFTAESILSKIEESVPEAVYEQIEGLGFTDGGFCFDLLAMAEEPALLGVFFAVLKLGAPGFAEQIETTVTTVVGLIMAGITSNSGLEFPTFVSVGTVASSNDPSTCVHIMMTPQLTTRLLTRLFNLSKPTDNEVRR